MPTPRMTRNHAAADRQTVRSVHASIHLTFAPGTESTVLRAWVASGLGASYRRGDLGRWSLDITADALHGMHTSEVLRSLLGLATVLVALPETIGLPGASGPEAPVTVVPESEGYHNGQIPGQAQLSIDLPVYNQKSAANPGGNGASGASTAGV